jgi:hypothetical protein
VLYDRSLPAPSLAEVRITAASPGMARQVAQVLRAWFACTEQRSCPAGATGTGTRLHLAVDSAHAPVPDRAGQWPMCDDVLEGRGTPLEPLAGGRAR